MSFANATCKTVPDKIDIWSGQNNYLGSFNDGDSVYIKPNLNINPLILEFVFENDEANCYVAGDIDFKLFQTSLIESANSLNEVASSNSTYESTAKFEFDLNVNLNSFFTSNYYVNEVPKGIIKFLIDSEGPEISLNRIEDNKLISGNENITIDYSLIDTGSGLNLLTITGAQQKIIEFDGEGSSGTLSYSFIPTKDTTLNFIAKDKLGNENLETINFIVDSEAPQVSDFSASYTYDGNIIGTFSTIISDKSFEYTTISPTVIADFSNLESGRNSVPGSCNPYSNSKYICYFRDILVNLDSSQSVNIDIFTKDSLDNQNTFSLNTDIDIDKNSPEILDFYVENSIGVKNKINAVSNSQIILRFREESIREGYPLIKLDTGLILFREEEICTTDNNIQTCIWNISSSASIYSPYEEYTDTYEISLTDYYGNNIKESITVNIENIKPEVTSVELIENDNIKNRLIQSQEEFNYRIIVKDENLDDGGDFFIKGNFASISSNQDASRFEASCRTANSTHARCDFNGIRALNGYINSSIDFIVYDSFGNLQLYNFPIEVLRIGNEVPESYSIESINTLNPINRNLFLENDVKSWFEGFIQKRPGTPDDIEIINYQLRECNEQDLNPILIIPDSIELYPEAVIFNENIGGNNIDENLDIFRFPFSIELLTYRGPANELNNKNMTCTLSIWKKDTENIYDAELVNFTINFQFYDEPRGNLLKAQAQNILDDINDARDLEETFGEYYDIYESLNSVCTAVNTVSGGVSAFNVIWQPIDAALSATGIGASFAAAGASVANPSQEATKGLEFLDAINAYCDYVTCRNGATIAGRFFSGDRGDIVGTEEADEVRDIDEDPDRTPLPNTGMCEGYNPGIGLFANSRNSESNTQNTE